MRLTAGPCLPIGTHATLDDRPLPRRTSGRPQEPRSATRRDRPSGVGRRHAPSRGNDVPVGPRANFLVSLPERLVRSLVALVGGTLHETAQLVLPRLVRRSRLY